MKGEKANEMTSHLLKKTRVRRPGNATLCFLHTLHVDELTARLHPRGRSQITEVCVLLWPRALSRWCYRGSCAQLSKTGGDAGNPASALHSYLNPAIQWIHAPRLLPPVTYLSGLFHTITSANTSIYWLHTLYVYSY